MIYFQNNIRLILVVVSVLLVQAVTLIAKNFKPESEFTEKKETHWTSFSLITCQVFMIFTAVLETVLFSLSINIYSYVGILLLLLILIITYSSYDTLGEHYSPKVEVKEGHELVDEGIYGYIRHPMYLAGLLFMLSVPLTARAYFSFVWLIPYLVILHFRIKYEEEVLSEDLKGYEKYMKRTKRLIPFIY